MIQSLYPIITILGGGYGCFMLLNRHFHHKFRFTEVFHCSLVLGSFILIIPWTFIGIHPDGIFNVFNVELIHLSISFENYAYLCYGILLLFCFYAIIHLMRSIVYNLESVSFSYIKKVGTLEIVLISLLIFDYLVIQFLLPIRGHDALNFYFPEAEIYYLSGRIVETNFLSYILIENAPLNTLLFTFTMYITNSDAFQLFPVVFLFGIALLGYNFTTEIWGDKAKGQLVMLLILVFPIFYWTNLYWVYNQDLFVCYFFTVSFYFIWKAIHNQNGFSRLYFLLGTLSGSLALLSNINAWPLFFIILLVIPTQKRGKILQSFLLSVITIFLITRVSTNIFIGLGFAILCYTTVILYHILRRPRSDTSISIRWIFFYFTGSIILGGFWFVDRIDKLSNFLDNIYNFYFVISDSIIWEYTSFQDYSLDITMEMVHSINFWSISLFLFLGLGFCLPWIIFKVISLIQTGKISPFVIWILFYFMIWITYYSSENIGYLSPIYVPLAVLIVHGFYSFIKFFNIPEDMRLPRLTLVFVGVLNFYYLIPFEMIINGSTSQDLLRLAHSQSAFYYYSHPIILILLTFIFALIWIVFALLLSRFLKRTKMRKTDQFIEGNLEIINKEKQILRVTDNTSLDDEKDHRVKEDLVQLISFNSQLITFENRKDFKAVISSFSNKLKPILVIFLLLAILIIPIGQQALVWFRNGDIDSFQGTLVFQFDEDYQNLIEKSLQHDNFYGAFLTVKTPGLQYFTQHPVLDFYYQSDILGQRFYDSNNLSYLVNILKHPAEFIKPPFDYEVPFQLIVVPNQQNINYDIYHEDIWNNSFFFQSLTNNSYFDLIYHNSKFIVFEIV